MNKMTDWFPAHIKPVHVGVYEVRPKGEKITAYSNWDGCKWGWYAETALKAFHEGSSISGSQDKQWRGFTEKQQ